MIGHARMPEVAHCKTCQAPIYWLKNRNSGKVAPIDAAPTTGGKGNVTPNLPDGSYIIVKPGAGTHLNHFSSCPDRLLYGSKAAPQP
jgi:hypothetical protein